VRALLEMGIFDALPPDGSSLSADVLAEKLKVEKDLLSRTSPLCDVYFPHKSKLDSSIDASGYPGTFCRSWETHLCAYPLLADLSCSSLEKHVQIYVC
jgi:hypothetical protein